jgi:hypothetical protein
VRLLPPVLNLGQFNNDFITGYTTLTHLIWAMVLPVNPWDVNKITLPFSTVSWWEFDLFVGILGTLFILFFGIFRWLVRRTDGAVYPALLLPLLGMVVLSMGRVYNLIMLLPIPLLNGERVSSRIISLPFVFLLILAAIEFQRWLDGHRQPLALRLAALLLLGIQISDMWLYIKLWQVSNVYPNYPQVPVDLAAKVVANHPDPVYTNILWIGAAVSLVTLIGLVILAFKKK